MGRFVALLLSGILLLCIGGCAATASTSEELIAIAREHVPIADACKIEHDLSEMTFHAICNYIKQKQDT